MLGYSTDFLTHFGRLLRWPTVLLLGCLSAGCNDAVEPRSSGQRSPGEYTDSVLRLVTTTSTRDSGLMDVLIPKFERDQSCRVDLVSVGTGAALKLGRQGDADVVIVHARQAEEAFMKAGRGVRHEEFMFNHFILLGPNDDPAGVKGSLPVEALDKIAAARLRFVSRGDDSGTHQRERQLWKQASHHPEDCEYIESGQGMGPTLVMADEMQAYVLSDQGTYLNFKNRIDLQPLTAPSEHTLNPYAAIVVNPVNGRRVNEALAQVFVAYLISEEAQTLIQDYRLHGEAVFHPTRLLSK